MTKKKLESFKIEDMQKPMPQTSKLRSRGTETPEAPSAGFANIEKLIEQERLDLDGLELRAQELTKLADEGSAQQKGAARKALAAYERTTDLLEYLWETKGSLAKDAG